MVSRQRFSSILEQVCRPHPSLFAHIINVANDIYFIYNNNLVYLFVFAVKDLHFGHPNVNIKSQGWNPPDVFDRNRLYFESWPILQSGKLNFEDPFTV